MELAVHLARDADTGRWYVAATELPGLWLEADSAGALMDRIAAAAPELIALNAAEIAAEGVVAVRPVFDSPLDLAA